MSVPPTFGRFSHFQSPSLSHPGAVLYWTQNVILNNFVEFLMFIPLLSLQIGVIGFPKQFLKSTKGCEVSSGRRCPFLVFWSPWNCANFIGQTRFIKRCGPINRNKWYPHILFFALCNFFRVASVFAISSGPFEAFLWKLFFLWKAENHSCIPKSRLSLTYDVHMNFEGTPTMDIETRV